MLEMFYRPQTGVNYNFIVHVYMVCVIIGVLLFSLEKWYKLLEIGKGVWIIFAPFGVSLPWALYMRSAATTPTNVDTLKKER